MIVTSEAEYHMQKVKRNAEYLAHLDRSIEQLECGEIVVKTLEELEQMADE